MNREPIMIMNQFKLPRLISDNMVLQRDAEIKIWGWAVAGEKITVFFTGKSYHTMADLYGKWQVTLSVLPVGGPYTMEIIAGHSITIKNILIGDVWVCSGQSNMELPMAMVKDRYAETIANSENSAIRQFKVPDRYDFKAPQDDLPGGSWEPANPESVLQYTAVGCFFARALFEKYGVPIGLINASVGGSPAESWMSADALKAFPLYLGTAEKYKNNISLNRIVQEDKTTSDAWENRLKQQDKGLNGERPWYEMSYDHSTWRTIRLPAYWGDEGLCYINGVVWFRKDIELPASMAGKPAQLVLGNIVDSDSVYINGSFAGSTPHQYLPRKYDIAENLLVAGKNTIVIRVINTIGRGGFVKDKPYQLTVGGWTIDLKGEWRCQIGAVAEPLPNQTFFQWQPLGLFNGMIAPLLNYSIKGVIWYQGEANVGRPLEYRKLFPELISNWRQKWNQGNFPFLYVQLPNYMEARNQPSESEWALLREAQCQTLAAPNTGMAVTVDIGEWNDLHPSSKEEVGKRLALAAQKVAYGEQNVVYSGPTYRSMEVEGGKIIIRFTNTGGGLVVKDGGELKAFAIADVTGRFVWAKARIKGDHVEVWNDQVARPVAVRYAWADNPEGANLYNKEGLPASPFRTDKY